MTELHKLIETNFTESVYNIATNELHIYSGIVCRNCFVTIVRQVLQNNTNTTVT